MTVTHNPHDKFVRSVVKNLPIAKDLFSQHLPIEISNNLNLNKLELTSESHIDENLKQFMSDIVFTCPYKDKSNNNKHAKIALLIEHQSNPDELIAFRVHHYLFNFLYSEQKRTKNKKLNAAYALVLYHGEQTPYPYSTNLIDSFDDPHNIMQAFLSNPVKLIDIGQIPDEQLQKQKLLGAIEQALKYSRTKNPEEHIIRIMQQVATLDFATHRELQLAVKLIINYMFSVASSINVETIIAAGSKIPQPIRGEYMTIAQQLEARGKVEGKAEEKVQIAKNMFSLGLSNEIIAQSTELSLEQVIELKNEQEQ